MSDRPHYCKHIRHEGGGFVASCQECPWESRNYATLEEAQGEAYRHLFALPEPDDE
jgi:hypothetical protein